MRDFFHRFGASDAACDPFSPVCMISLALIALLVSLVATLWVRRLFRRQACRYAADAPQRFHFGDTPRMGGLGMLAGWALALAALPLLQALHLAGNIDRPRLDLTLWLLMLLPAFAGGVLEDMTQRLAVRWRLLLTLTSGLLAWGLLNALGVRLSATPVQP